MQAAKPSEKRIAEWYYFLVYPAFAIFGFVMRMGFGLIWANIFIGYGLIPLLDQVLSHDWINPTPQQMQRLQKDRRFKLILYLIVLMDWLMFSASISQISTVTWYNFLPRLFAMINIYTSGFLISHELFHKHNMFDKVIGTVNMIKTGYMHFMVEHIYGHHKNVSTPLDPASAPKGMTVYEFIPKSIVGSFKSAYRINPRFVMLSVLASSIFLLTLYKLYGLGVLIMHLTISFGSISYLEAINYIEHYGLRRKQLPDGSYERVNIKHSWNAAHKISNFLLFKLQRHSDHHQNSLKTYQTLCTYQDSPQLPHGYLVCILLTFFPSTWFSIMNPLVDEYQSNNHTKGTQLEALRIADIKTREFTKKCFIVTLSTFLIDITVKVLSK